MSKEERRKFPRVKDNNIEIKLSGEGFDTITQSLDISASGIYCQVDHPLPVMTKVEVVLVLPGKTKAAKPAKLDTEGVVVREQAIKKNGKLQHYDIAIFFNALTPKERELLVKYTEK